MPVEIESFGNIVQQMSIEPGTSGVIDDFGPRISVSCYRQDQGGAILGFEGGAGYDVVFFAKDDDLTGQAIDPTTPDQLIKFSGSVTIGIATRTCDRVVFLKHKRAHGPELQEALPAPRTTAR